MAGPWQGGEAERRLLPLEVRRGEQGGVTLLLAIKGSPAGVVSTALRLHCWSKHLLRFIIAATGGGLMIYELLSDALKQFCEIIGSVNHF